MPDYLANLSTKARDTLLLSERKKRDALLSSLETSENLISQLEATILSEKKKTIVKRTQASKGFLLGDSLLLDDKLQKLL